MKEGRLIVTHAVCEGFSTRMEALNWVEEVVEALSLESFAHSIPLKAHRADVYGIVVDDRGWYLKLTISESADEAAVLIISCHPLEFPLKTRKGMLEP